MKNVCKVVEREKRDRSAFCSAELQNQRAKPSPVIIALREDGQLGLAGVDEDGMVMMLNLQRRLEVGEGVGGGGESLGKRSRNARSRRFGGRRAVQKPRAEAQDQLHHWR